MVILKETYINKDNFPFAQGGVIILLEVKCNKFQLLVYYKVRRYTTRFAMPIVGFLRYCHVPRLQKFVTKTVIIHSEIFIQRVCPLHNDVSTENITIFTRGSDKYIEWCNFL